MQREDNINLITLFHNFYRYKWSVLFILFFTLLITFFYIKKIVPIYSSNILISINNDESSRITSLFPNSNIVNIDMESKLDYDITILKSRHIISKILEKIDFSKRVFIEKRWREQELYKEEIPFLLKLKSEKSKKDSFDLILEEINRENFTLKLRGEKESNSTTYKYNQTIKIENYKLQINKKKYNNSLLGQKYIIKIENNKNILVSNILNNLSIEKEVNKLLKISYEDRVPTRTKDVITQIVSSYETYDLNARQLKDVNNIAFFDKMILELEETIKEIGNKLRKYRSTHSELLLLGSEDKVFSNIIEENRKLAELSLQLNALKSTQKRIKKGIYSTSLLENSNLRTTEINQLVDRLREKKEHLNLLHQQKNDITTLVIDDVTYNSILSRLQKAKNELKELSLEYTSNYPKVSKTKTDIKTTQLELKNYLNNNINSYIKENIQIKREVNKTLNALIYSIQKEYSTIKSLLEKDKKAVDKLPKSTMELEALRRAFKLNENNYKRLLQKKSESLISKESIFSNIQIVDSATDPFSPIKPKQNFLYLSSLILGLILSILYSSFRIYRDREIYSKHDIRVRDYSIIYSEKKESKYDFWTLITHIERAFTSKKSKIIFITANDYGENKNFITKNLSLVLNNISKSILIIDFDIYNAKLTYNLKKDSYMGLSTLLTSKHGLDEIDIKEYIYEINSKYQNIDILPSGPIIPNGSALLFNSKIKTLIDALSQEYDYILIDAPPMGKYPEITILLKYINILLVVAKIKKTDKRFFEELNKIHEKKIEKIILLTDY